MVNKLRVLTLLIFSSIMFVSCFGKYPIFTEMSTGRLKVVIKGTYETNAISHFPAMPTVNGSLMQDSSVDEVTSGGSDSLPDAFMFDIAEIRLNGDKISNYRYVHSFALSDSEPFFNGNGVELQSDDPYESYYDTVQVYIRKMVFDNAVIYDASGSGFTYEKASTVVFHENIVNGFDFNQFQVNSHWDSLRKESADTLRIFPLNVPIIGGLQYNKQNEETVLEIRFVIKNFVKKFEYKYYEDGTYKVCHYFALSDWLNDVRSGENDLGGNLQAVARSYVTGRTGTITATTGAGPGYIFVVPSGSTKTDYFPTANGSTTRSNCNCDLPHTPTYPGSYIAPVLDYYLKYEKYKYDYNQKVPSPCTDFTTYESEWDTFENTVSKFKIPPYVVYFTSSPSTFDVAPGSYDLYMTTTTLTYGNLYLDTNVSLLKSGVVVTEGANATAP